MVHVISHISGHRRTLCINKKDATVQDVLEVLREKEGQVSDVVLQSGSQILTHALPLPNDVAVVATLRLPGGKGGFGSMLRAIGAQIEKTTNREACRDLSGRRLRDINEEKRLKDFISKKAEREREVQERKRQKYEKLKETPRHIFQDESYYQQRELREKNLFDSLDKAFSNQKNGGPSGVKRSCPGEAEAAAKLKRGRFIDDLDESSDESGSDDESTSDSERKGNSSDNSERKGSSSDEDISSPAQTKNSTVTNDSKQIPSVSSKSEEVSSSTAGSEAASGCEEKQPEAVEANKS